MNKTFEKLVELPLTYMMEGGRMGASRALDEEKTPISHSEITEQYMNLAMAKLQRSVYGSHLRWAWYRHALAIFH